MQRLVGRDKKGKKMLINVPSWEHFNPAPFIISNGPNVIQFADMTTRINFKTSSLGNVALTYAGFKWGYSAASTTGGFASAIFTNTGSPVGWASAQSGNSIFGSNPVLAYSSPTFAWNQGSVKSLWIDFSGSADFIGGWFSPGKTSLTASDDTVKINNAASLTFSAYNSSGTVVAVTSMSLDNTNYTWQPLTCNTSFTNISYLEILANPMTGSGADNINKFFAVDNLIINKR